MFVICHRAFVHFTIKKKPNVNCQIRAALFFVKNVLNQCLITFETKKNCIESEKKNGWQLIWNSHGSWFLFEMMSHLTGILHLCFHWKTVYFSIYGEFRHRKWSNLNQWCQSTERTADGNLFYACRTANVICSVANGFER